MPNATHSPPMPERALQRAVEDCARLFGWRCYHTYDSRRSEPGYPDLCMVRGSRLIYAELKTKKGVLSAAQMAWLADLQLTPAEVYIWRPVDWLDGTVERVLR